MLKMIPAQHQHVSIFIESMLHTGFSIQLELQMCVADSVFFYLTFGKRAYKTSVEIHSQWPLLWLFHVKKVVISGTCLFVVKGQLCREWRYSFIIYTGRVKSIVSDQLTSSDNNRKISHVRSFHPAATQQTKWEQWKLTSLSHFLPACVWQTQGLCS